jgi:hypothetical protein
MGRRAWRAWRVWSMGIGRRRTEDQRRRPSNGSRRRKAAESAALPCKGEAAFINLTETQSAQRQTGLRSVCEFRVVRGLRFDRSAGSGAVPAGSRNRLASRRCSRCRCGPDRVSSCAAAGNPAATRTICLALKAQFCEDWARMFTLTAPSAKPHRRAAWGKHQVAGASALPIT